MSSISIQYYKVHCVHSELGIFEPRSGIRIDRRVAWEMRVDPMKHINNGFIYSQVNEDGYYEIFNDSDEKIAQALPFTFFEEDEVFRVYIDYVCLKDSSIRLPTPDEQRGKLFMEEIEEPSPSSRVKESGILICTVDEYMERMNNYVIKFNKEHI